MGFSRTYSATVTGVTGRIIHLETHIAQGLPGVHIVGLADTAIKESRARIKSALKTSGFVFPKTRTVINLSPASVPKSGSQFDLALCMSLLAGQYMQRKGVSLSVEEEKNFSARVSRTMFLGELGLDGSVKRIPGILPILRAVQERNARSAAACAIDAIVIPEENSAEAALIPEVCVYVVRHLAQVERWARGECSLVTAVKNSRSRMHDIPDRAVYDHRDMADVSGQSQAKRAAEIAAAGGHNCMMIGPPGSGKSMIARRLPGIMPPLTEKECIEATTIHSVVGRSYNGPIIEPPFVAPHPHISRSGLLGGGSGRALPGAVSLAHCGVLFLDEASEVPASSLDALRTPLEDGYVRIVRSREDIVFPASFQLILAANPCRCGAEDTTKCRCPVGVRRKYLTNISGPLKDRIDMFVRTHASGSMVSTSDDFTTDSMALRVRRARMRARARWEAAAGVPHGIVLNAQVNARIIRRDFPADDVAMAFISARLVRGEISQRGVDRILRLAWTLRDLEDDPPATPTLVHVSEAMEYRCADMLGAVL